MDEQEQESNQVSLDIDQPDTVSDDTIDLQTESIQSSQDYVPSSQR